MSVGSTSLAAKPSPETPFVRAPLAEVDGIPVFSAQDAYVENYDRIARDHLAAMASAGVSNPFIDEDVWQVIEQSTAALLRRHVPETARVLDVGVGTGRLLSDFPKLKRHGLDVSIDYLRVARDKGIEVCCARVEDMPYADAFFDAVISTDVLEHVIDLHQAMTAMDRVLKPGGLLIVRVPDREDLTPYLAPDYPYRFAHLRQFDEASLRLLLGHVFDYAFLERSFAHVMAHPKFRGRSKVASWLAMRVVRLLSGARPAAEHPLVRRLYGPMVINVVFRKPTPRLAQATP